LFTLKSYGFELNLNKCKFLRNMIKYLRYIISTVKITINPRHKKAIDSFSWKDEKISNPS